MNNPGFYVKDLAKLWFGIETIQTKCYQNLNDQYEESASALNQIVWACHAVALALFDSFADSARYSISATDAMISFSVGLFLVHPKSTVANLHHAIRETLFIPFHIGLIPLRAIYQIFASFSEPKHITHFSAYQITR